MAYLLALDQGTSSTRSMVFDCQGNCIAMAQQALQQHYPRPDWVEHDPYEIWDAQLATSREAITRAEVDVKEIKAIGITNQRETTLLWDRKTGVPVHRAIVWQDRRTEALCARLQELGLENAIRSASGLRIDAYFSGSKILWLLDHIPAARALAKEGRLAFGTIDTWLIWQLTKGRRHVTDVTNASRTLLFNIHHGRWDDDLLAALDITPAILPEVLPSVAEFGHCDPEFFGVSMPITGVAGDQQAALFGQACFHEGMAKNTYGTGCFMLMNTGTGAQPSQHGLLTTPTAQIDKKRHYALEGSVFIAGAVVQWLRDGLGIISHSKDVEALAHSVPDSGGVTVVPAFTGLGAPWWQPQARGIITGITQATTRAHIVRAAVESIAFQSASMLQAMSQDAVETGARPLRELRVDGGASVNNALMQFQADLLGITVVRPKQVETTSLGAAWLAGLGCGVYQSLDELAALWREDCRFEPQISREQASQEMARWEHAVRQACHT